MTRINEPFIYSKIQRQKGLQESNIHRNLLTFAIIIFAGSLFIGYSAYVTHKKMLDSDNLVRHTEQVINQSDKIISIWTDLIIASRGFIFTKDSSYLKPYLKQESIYAHIENLAKLVHDNPSQNKRVDSLNYFVHKYINYSYETFELRSNEGLESTIAFILTHKGKWYTDQIRQITNNIQLEENNLLRVRREVNEKSVNRFKILSIIIFFLMDLSTVLLLIALYKNMNQDQEKAQRAGELIIANKELAFQNGEKEKHAKELINANIELAFQIGEKGKNAVELILAKEKAEKSDQLKSAFLRNMSHEIRTPLTAIIGFSSLLNDENISKEEIKDYTDLIDKSGKRLIEIVTNILDISSIQTGQVEIKKSSVFIESVFSNLYQFYYSFADEKQIHLSYHNQNDKLRFVYTDESKLYQILSNLLKNAIKFTNSGSIDFGYEVSDNSIRFYVKDTGIGIAPELFNQLFDSFSQLDLSLKRRYEGAGLGLAICSGLSKLLGGNIWIESLINKGSTFFFTIPNDKQIT